MQANEDCSSLGFTKQNKLGSLPDTEVVPKTNRVLGYVVILNRQLLLITWLGTGSGETLHLEHHVFECFQRAQLLRAASAQCARLSSSEGWM